MKPHTHLKTIDLAEYLQKRKSMRLATNIIDLLIIYAIFKPVEEVGRFTKFFFGERSYLFNIFMNQDETSIQVSMVGPIIIFIAFVSIKALFFVALYNWMRAKFLSDDTGFIFILSIFILTYTFIVFLVPGFTLLGHSYIGFLLLSLSIIQFFLCGVCFWYVDKVRYLEKNPLYRPLTHVNRTSFSYSNIRYRFPDSSSLMSQLRILIEAWRVLAFYVLSLVFIAAVAMAMFSFPESWQEYLAGWKLAALGIVFVVIVNQSLAHGRNFIANEAMRVAHAVRRRLARSASEVSRYDPRPPILFLRSFRDDEIVVKNYRTWGHRFLSMKNYYVRLEEISAEVLYAFGPIVAASNPEDSLPPLGAARENISTTTWRQTIEEHMDRATLMVFVLGNTEGLRWELTRAISKGYWSKCMIIVPPSYNQQENPASRICSELEKSGLHLRMHHEKASESNSCHGLVVFGLQDNSGMLVCGREESLSIDYTEAILFGASMIKSGNKKWKAIFKLPATDAGRPDAPEEALDLHDPRDLDEDGGAERDDLITTIGSNADREGG